MALPPVLQNLALPIIGAPLFIISNPKLVVEQCKAGIVGAVPSLNARPASQLDDWLAEITETLAAHDRAHPDRPAAPFAINQIVHKSNDRLEHDMALCVKYQVPIIITSLGPKRKLDRITSASPGMRSMNIAWRCPFAPTTWVWNVIDSSTMGLNPGYEP